MPIRIRLVRLIWMLAGSAECNLRTPIPLLRLWTAHSRRNNYRRYRWRKPLKSGGAYGQFPNALSSKNRNYCRSFASKKNYETAINWKVHLGWDWGTNKVSKVDNLGKVLGTQENFWYNDFSKKVGNAPNTCLFYIIHQWALWFVWIVHMSMWKWMLTMVSDTVDWKVRLNMGLVEKVEPSSADLFWWCTP